MSTTDVTLVANGLRVACRISSGTGRPVLMLHGSGASARVFAHQFNSELGETFRLVGLDLPGHGRSEDSPYPATDYTVTGLARVVDSAVEQLDLQAAAIYGWSLGGHVAIQLASMRSDIAGLALTGAPPIGPGAIASLRGFHARWDMLLASKGRFSQADAERFMRLCYGDAGTPTLLEEIRRADGRLRQQFLRSLMRGEGTDQKRAVETAPFPVAMIDGEHDPIVRRSYIEHLDYRELWRGRCHVISGAGHAPFLQQPAAFNQLLHRFVRDLALRPAGGEASVASRA